MPNKKSLLIGINYKGQQAELKGCINDAKNVKQFLIETYNYPSDGGHMIMLTEDATDRNFLPTKQNMMNAFRWLINGNKPGDHLFLHYSGHGGQVKDHDGDRPNGMDDTIIPVDYQKAGQINSDELHDLIVDGVQKGVKLTCIFDCCHSGTVLELPFTYRSDEEGHIYRFNLANEAKHVFGDVMAIYNGGLEAKLTGAKDLFSRAKAGYKMFESRHESPTQSHAPKQPHLEDQHFVRHKEEKEVYLFSGCRDEQTSADTSVNGVGVGAMSFAMLQALKKNPQMSYEELLKDIRAYMVGRYSQVPQLSVGYHDADLKKAIDP